MADYTYLLLGQSSFRNVSVLIAVVLQLNINVRGI